LLFAITIYVSWYVKGNRAGGVELHGETQTAKSILKVLYEIGHQIWENRTNLSSVTSRLTNLTRIVYHKRIAVE
jgi:hypothetical protein